MKQVQPVVHNLYKGLKDGECMEIIKDGETIGRIHEDYCCKDDEEVKKILDNVAQKVYQHLAAQNGDAHVLKESKAR